jgi:tRNA 2-thiouridine synthesizing protein A
MTAPERYDVFLDARGLACPWPLVKARQALMVVESGATVCVLATDPAARADFEHFCAATGHTLLRLDKRDEVLIVVLQKS